MTNRRSGYFRLDRLFPYSSAIISTAHNSPVRIRLPDDVAKPAVSKPSNGSSFTGIEHSGRETGCDISNDSRRSPLQTRGSDCGPPAYA